MFKSLISNSRRQLFFNLILFILSFAWVDSFSFSVLKPHFINQGLTIEQILIGTTYSFAGSCLILLIIKKISSKLSWSLALITSFVYILLIVKISNISQFYFASFIFGFVVSLFYVAYNIAHYQLTPTHRTGYSSAIMFSIFPIIGLIAPIFAGWLAEIDYRFIWILSCLFYLINFILIKFQSNFSISYNLLSGFKAIKPTRIFLFIEGVWETLVFGIIPIFSLNFIKTPLYYGTFLAYLSSMSVIANLVLGKLSDKLQKRLLFLYPVTILMAITTFLFPLVLSNLLFWLILAGLIQFLCPLFWNFSTSFFVDVHPNVKQSMPIRELILNLGRVLGFILVIVNFRFESTPRLIFPLLGVIMLLYPAILFYNTKVSHKYQYL